MPKILQSNPNDDRFVDDVEWWEEHFRSLEDTYDAERKVQRDPDDAYKAPRYRSKRRRVPGDDNASH